MFSLRFNLCNPAINNQGVSVGKWKLFARSKEESEEIKNYNCRNLLHHCGHSLYFNAKKKSSWITFHFHFHSEPTLIVPDRGKAWAQKGSSYFNERTKLTSFRHASRSDFDLNLNKGRLPRTVSSFLSSLTSVVTLAASSLCWTWQRVNFSAVKSKKKSWNHHLNCFSWMLRPHVTCHSRVGGFSCATACFAPPHQLVLVQASHQPKIT